LTYSPLRFGLGARGPSAVVRGAPPGGAGPSVINDSVAGVPAVSTAVSRVASVTIGGGGVGVASQKVTDFLDSLGMNLHTEQGPTPASYTSLLTYLGVRRARARGNAAQLITMANTAGVKILVITNGESITTVTNLASALAGAGVLSAVDGPNEPNNQPFQYPNPGPTGGGTGTWVPVANYCRDLYIAVKANVGNYPIYATYPGAETDNVGLQFLIIPTPTPPGVLLTGGTKFADYAGLHNYIKAVVSNNCAWNNAGPLAGADGLRSSHGVTWLHGYQGYTDTQLQNLTTVPRTCTEIGWSNSGDFNYGMSTATIGAWMLNTFCSQFARGFKETYWYQIREGEGGTPTWGIFSSAATGSTPLEGATYLHNMTTILADTGVASTANLNYSIPSQPATVHSLLLRKSNNKFYLIVWNELVTGSSAITINLGATFSSVNVYDPIVGTSVITALTNVNSVARTLTNHPVILEIS
jgi:hypothetical protein